MTKLQKSSGTVSKFKLRQKIHDTIKMIRVMIKLTNPTKINVLTNPIASPICCSGVRKSKVPCVRLIMMIHNQ